LWLGQSSCRQHLDWPLSFITNKQTNEVKSFSAALFVICLLASSAFPNREIDRTPTPKIAWLRPANAPSQIRFENGADRFSFSKKYLRGRNSSTQDVPCNAKSLTVRRDPLKRADGFPRPQRRLLLPMLSPNRTCMKHGKNHACDIRSRTLLLCNLTFDPISLITNP
jgi:hypothetical protein